MTFEIPTASQLISLTLTMVLCGLIGFEREYRGKDAGIRTNVLVGLGSWMFTMASLYGYNAVVNRLVTWDGSRIAAQIVSGIGFIGAGVIFFHRDSVRGLTTAAGIWLSSAVGMAAACNLLALACLVTVCYFITVLTLAPVAYKLTHKFHPSVLRVSYENGRGSLRRVLIELGQAGLSTEVFSSHSMNRDEWSGVSVGIRVRGTISSEVLDAIMKTEGVKDVDVITESET